MRTKNEVFLFFHGFTGSKEYFPNTEIDGVCIVSFDRPGIGESSVIPYYSMEKYAQSVHDVLTKKLNN